MLQDSVDSWTLFYLLLVVEVFRLQKAVQLLEEVVVSWREVRWIWQMRQNFCSPSCSTVEALVVWCTDRHCHGEELDPFCWPNQFQALSFLVRLIDLLSVLLRYNGFTVCSGSDRQQMTKQWPWPFCGACLALGSALELLLGPTTEMVITSCCIKSTVHHVSQSNWEMIHCCGE